MKKFAVLMGSLTLIFMVFVAMKSTIQEDPPVTKQTAHIKKIIITDGKKQVFDTVITGTNLKVFSMNGDKNFNWVASDDFAGMDSLLNKYEIRSDDGTQKRIIVMKNGDNNENIIIRRMKAEGDSVQKVTVHVEKMAPESEDVLFFDDKVKGTRRMITVPLTPGMPLPPNGKVFGYHQNQQGNMIDLADPGVISFKKKKMSGGREKITIIRKAVSARTEETFDVFMDDKGNNLKIMNEPRVVRELDLKEKVPGQPGVRKVEIDVKTAPEKK